MSARLGDGRAAVAVLFSSPTVAGVLHQAVAAASPSDLVSPSASIWTRNQMEVAPWRLQADPSAAWEAAHTSGDSEHNGNVNVSSSKSFSISKSAAVLNS